MVDLVLVLVVAGTSALAGFSLGALIMANRIPVVLARMTAKQLSAMAERVDRLRRH